MPAVPDQGVPPDRQLLAVPDSFRLLLHRSPWAPAMALAIRWPLFGTSADLDAPTILSLAEQSSPLSGEPNTLVGRRTGGLRDDFEDLLPAWHNARTFALAVSHPGDRAYRYWSRFEAALAALFEEYAARGSKPATFARSAAGLVVAGTRTRSASNDDGIALWLRAEQDVARWLMRLGASNVRVTQRTRDGGADVRADGVAAEVKYWQHGSIGVKDVRALRGAARNEHALFFATVPFTADAIKEAERLDVALFRFDLRGITVWSQNDLADHILVDGLPLGSV